MCTVIKNKDVKARKEYRCEYCNGLIKKGETYNCSTNVFDGDIYNWKTHCCCNELASTLSMYDDYEDGLNSEGFSEEVSEYVNTFHHIHFDEEGEDLDPHWNKSIEELVPMILEEYNSNDFIREMWNNRNRWDYHINKKLSEYYNNKQ